MLAALTYQKNSAQCLALLWQLVETLQKNNVKIGGLLNRLSAEGKVDGDTVCSVADDREFTILYPLSDTSKACRLDDQALAESSIVIQEAIENRVDLLFISKFGMAEAEGRGLYQEFVQAAANGIPVITVVKERYLPEWNAFTQQSGRQLEPAFQKVLDWVSECTGLVKDSQIRGL